MIYFDNAATTRPDPVVVSVMNEYLTEQYANPSAGYSFSAGVRSDIYKARSNVAKLIGCLPEEVLFTSGGTESDNTAVIGGSYAGLLKLRGGAGGCSVSELIARPGPIPTVITSMIEHPAVLKAAHRLEKMGFRVIYLRPDLEGRISPDKLRSAMTDGTVLVSIMHANNEIGTIEDIASFGSIAHEYGALFHTDAVQTLGHEHIDVKEMNTDMLSGSGHKLYGPKGVGILYVKRSVKLEPYIVGGGQENGLRSGTENVPAIMGLSKAASLAYERMDADNAYIMGLRDRMYLRLTELTDGCVLNGAPLMVGSRLAGNLHVSFKDVEGSSLIIRLDMKGIMCSTGSACSQGEGRPSHVMEAIGADRDTLNGSLRLSLSRYNTESEVDSAAEQIAKEVEFLRSVRC